MNSLRRMLAVLELLRPDRPTLEVDDICRLLGYAPATAYRYVRELVDVGLLVRLPGGYGLGPRIIEFDLLIRETDPLLNRSRDLVAALAAQTGLNVLLSELYDDKVVTIHQEQGVEAQALNFGRGRPMPLFRSATSRVILAWLPARRLRRVHDAHAQAPELHALGADWKSFARAHLRRPSARARQCHPRRPPRALRRLRRRAAGRTDHRCRPGDHAEDGGGLNGAAEVTSGLSSWSALRAAWCGRLSR